MARVNIGVHRAARIEVYDNVRSGFAESPHFYRVISVLGEDGKEIAELTVFGSAEIELKGESK